jgi:hypothetical protein
MKYNVEKIKIKIKDIDPKKDTISCFFTREWTKYILILNYPSDNYNL